MAATTNLEIVTPSMVIISEPAEMVVIPGADGNIGVLPRHSNLMSNLHRGVIDIYNENKISSKVMIDGGIAEINEASIVILAERAEKLEKSNKHIFQEKLSQFKAETNNADKNIADMASKNVSFMQAVIDNIS
jgi:F-type H+-transporting ATPase subunit epsilon